MGGHPYWYFVPYREDLQAVLDQLREREFRAGRYNPAIPFLEFEEPAFSRQTPGPAHRSMELAVEDSGESGTRSILDVERISTRPGPGVAAPLPASRLQALFGTDRPSRADVQSNLEYFDDIDRGECIYIILYDQGTPTEVYFAGYSFD